MRNLKIQLSEMISFRVRGFHSPVLARTRIFIGKGILAILLLLAPVTYSQGPGSLDPSFGTGGLALTDVNGTNDGANGMAIQTDGKIVTGGRGTGGTLIRYNVNGTLDTTFGTGGIATQMLSPYATEITDVALQSDGKIVYSGHQNDASGNHFFVIGRAAADGSLDTSFGTSGFVRTAFGTGGVASRSLLIQPDGKIVVAGYAFLINGAPAVFAVARYDAAGTPDAGFGDGGKVTTAFDGSTDFGDQAQAVALAPDGRIVVGGTRFAPTTFRDCQAARYNTDGSLDQSFGIGGKVVTHIMNNDICRALAVQTDGKVLLGGDSNNQLSFAVLRYAANGALDPTFGSGGIKTGPPLVSDNFISSLAVQPDGKILAAGASNLFPDRDVTVVRYNPDGSVDSTFGNGGVVITPIAVNRLDGPTEIKLQTDGKIVVTGSSEGDTFVLRYLNNTFAAPRRPPFDFDGDGKTDLGIFRPAGTASEWWLNRSSNGQTFALQFGASTDKITPADYTGDGKTDIAFFRPSSGEWFVLRSEDFSFFALPFGTNGDVPVPADYDADGKADFAVFRQLNSTWFISQSSGAPPNIFQFGLAGDRPVVADYDGDGKADVGIFRAASVGAEWWIERSTAGPLAVQFGSATDKPVQGDYTGDGKSDIAIWRPSSGEWFIVRSQDFSFYGFPFGTSGDVPSPGDYDDDGKYDPTVFRPSGAIWFIGRTTAGTQIVQFGANGDRPIPNAFVP
ncbi:MAG TPA: FG-GAP-like repeat-containing protein [Pyrinomonadaceae bacterium]|nr:FG-GAP-like repeat-containing protein [Pyrinomonadaceae bacterium]